MPNIKRTKQMKPIRAALLFVFSAASFASFSSYAGDGCAWLRLPDVERAFPQPTPWKDSANLSGNACRFSNDGAKPARSFSLSQRFHPSTAEAVEVARRLKEELREDYRIEPMPELGRESFYYTPQDEPDDAATTQTTFWVVQNQRLILMGALVVPPPLQAEEKAALTDLLRKAVDSTQQPLVSEKLADASGLELVAQ
jgi:hypothetical protein